MCEFGNMCQFSNMCVYVKLRLALFCLVVCFFCKCGKVLLCFLFLDLFDAGFVGCVTLVPCVNLVACVSLVF